MNAINVGEVYYRTAKDISLDRAEAVLKRLSIMPILWVSNTSEQVLEAARLKARFPISYADAFALATAQREKASLVTGDPEFRAVEHLVPILWI